MVIAAMAAPMVITRDKKSSLLGAKLQHKVKPFVLIVVEIFLAAMENCVLIVQRQVTVLRYIQVFSKNSTIPSKLSIS